MSQENNYLKNHIIIYLIQYKIDFNKKTPIYKVGKTIKPEFMSKFSNNCILLYQRIIENKCDLCNNILYNFKNIYTMRNDIGNGCFEGDFNNMIKLINSMIDEYFSSKISPPIMDNNFIIKVSEQSPQNILLVSPKNIIKQNTNIDKIENIRVQSAVRMIEKHSKEGIENIKKYVKCLSKERINNEYDNIGNCLNNIDYELFELWSNLIPQIETNNPFTISPRWNLNIKWERMSLKKYNIANLKLWAMFDNMEQVFNIIENDIIRSISKVGCNITPYNMTMISYKHFKHFHIYTNNKWYYYDVQSYKWEEDIDNLNIKQSLIGNVLIIFERYTNYEKIIKMYNDSVIIENILKDASTIFFNKNNYSKEYLMENMIDYNNLP